MLDPFAGSGTRLVAAEKTGRRGYGIELDPRYCDVIVRRMAGAANSGRWLTAVRHGRRRSSRPKGSRPASA